MAEHARGLRFVEDGDGKADMDQHIVADPRLRDIGQLDFLDDAAEIDAADTQDRIALRQAQDLARNG